MLPNLQKEQRPTARKKSPTSNTDLVFACFQRNVLKAVTMSHLVQQTGLKENQVLNAWKYLRDIRKEDIVKHNSGGSDYFVYKVKVAGNSKKPAFSYDDAFKKMNGLESA